MGSLRLVEIPVKVPISKAEGPRIELVVDWEKHMYPSAAEGYRVKVIEVQPDDVVARVVDTRDYGKLSSALRYCARYVQELERGGW